MSTRLATLLALAFVLHTSADVLPPDALEGGPAWELLLTNDLNQGPFEFTDPSPASDPHRFDRAVAETGNAEGRGPP